MHVLAACRGFTVRGVQRKREGERQVAIQGEVHAVGVSSIVVVIRGDCCVELLLQVWCVQVLVSFMGVVVKIESMIVIVVIVAMFVQMFMGKCGTKGVLRVRNVRRLIHPEQQGVIQHQQQRKKNLSRHAKVRPGLVISRRL